MDLRHRLIAVLHDNKNYANNEFVPDPALRELVTDETVLGALERRGIAAERDLAERIVSTARKLFAMLVLIEQEHHILEYLNCPLCDSDLPIEGARVPNFYFDEEGDFFRIQLKFPPVFERQTHVEIPKDMVLPFLSRSYVDGGRFGLVFKVEVAKGHLSGCGEKFVALKQIRKDEHEPWDNIMNELETLRKREHPNIVPLLASFVSSDVQSGYEEKSLNLIFPYADMNMDTWMNRNQTPSQLLNISKEGRRKYLYQSMYQLVSALSFLHRERDGMVTSHHDLKPKNILLLGNTFVICDLGRSQLIPLAQGSETDGHKGTFAYHPPEYWNDDGTRASRSHGRAFDVWSMGCILTELATLVVFGWEKEHVRKYREARLLAPGWRQFKNQSLGGQKDDSFHNHMDAVNGWISELKKTDGSRVLCGCLDIAMDMLNMTPAERLPSWEAELDFFELLYPDTPRVVRLEKGALCVQPPGLAMPSGVQTPVHRAILRGNRDRVDQLLQAGWPVPNKSVVGLIPIQGATQGEGLLVGNLVPQDIKTRDSAAGYEILTGSDEFESLKRAIRNKSTDDVNNIIIRSRSLQELLKRKDEYGLTALHWAARFGTLSVVELMLAQVDAAALEIKDDSGKNILHHGSECAPETVISLILTACPDREKLLRDKDSSGKLPLHWAAQSGNASAAKLLLESASDPSAMLGEEDDRGNSPLRLARKYDKVEVESVLGRISKIGTTFSPGKYTSRAKNS